MLLVGFNQTSAWLCPLSADDLSPLPLSRKHLYFVQPCACAASRFHFCPKCYWDHRNYQFLHNNLLCLLMFSQIWNNIISLSFVNEDFTTRWRHTFTRDFEGKFKQVCIWVRGIIMSLDNLMVFHCKVFWSFCLQEKHLDQVDVYCSKMEELNDSHPHIARSIEKCALDAVTALCQVSHFTVGLVLGKSPQSIRKISSFSSQFGTFDITMWNSGEYIYLLLLHCVSFGPSLRLVVILTQLLNESSE